MTLDELKKVLSAFAHIQIIKEGYVFTVLMTGKGLSNSQRVMSIQKHIMNYTADKYPLIEAIRNDDTFFCLILKPKS